MQLADVIVSHIGGASGTSDFAIYYALRNIVWTYLKNMPAPFIILFFPGMLAATFTLAVRYTFSGNGRAAWKGIYDAFKNMGGAWQKRKTIQKIRRSSLKELLLSMTWLPLQPLSHLFRPRDHKYFAQ